jgi:hypothetical protein
VLGKALLMSHDLVAQLAACQRAVRWASRGAAQKPSTYRFVEPHLEGLPSPFWPRIPHPDLDGLLQGAAGVGALLILSIMGIVLFQIVAAIERIFFPWSPGIDRPAL